MNEIKSVNTIYNSGVLVSYSDKSEQDISVYTNAFFLPKEASSEWIVDIQYREVKQDDITTTDSNNFEKVKGELKFINPNDANDVIEFDFCRDSKIAHNGSLDEFILNPTAHNPNIQSINIVVAHENEETIVQGLYILANHSEKINDRLVNYEQLEFMPSITVPALTSNNIQTIEESSVDLDIVTIFTTNYYLDSYANFNPFHG